MTAGPIVCEVRSSYELGIKPVVRYRIDPTPPDWMANEGTDSAGWRTNIWEAGRKLWLTEQAIEVQGPGDRGFNYTDPFWVDSLLDPRQTTMRTVRLRSMWRVYLRRPIWGEPLSLGPYLFPWPKVKFLALSSPLPDDSGFTVEFTVAVQPLGGQFDRVSAALRNVGVREA